ncbi:MAG: CoA transferase, partial [Acidimicrobiales bacterium]
MNAAVSLRAAWVESGALGLTGAADGPPLVPPARLLERVAAIGRRVDVDAFDVLAERAALGGLRRAGQTSCGGATRLLRCTDGWLAVSLARPDDVASIPAWLEIDPLRADADTWGLVDNTLARERVAVALERAVLLGLPAARLGERQAIPGGPVTSTRCGDAAPAADAQLVVDLSALWAGPVCARVLRHNGAQVVKVESRQRPDGARRGPAAFFDALHTGSRAVAVDLDDHGDRERLRALLAAADVVIEASRPRALAQHGLDADALVRHGPRVWVSI